VAKEEERRGAFRYDAVVATFVGVCALFVSGYTAYVQRQQVRAAVATTANGTLPSSTQRPARRRKRLRADASRPQRRNLSRKLQKNLQRGSSNIIYAIKHGARGHTASSVQIYGGERMFDMIKKKQTFNPEALSKFSFFASFLLRPINL
jgi:hypothetical protein